MHKLKIWQVTVWSGLGKRNYVLGIYIPEREELTEQAKEVKNKFVESR